ncbi:MAG: hypothetical protein J0L88_02930 [Xanthomonadales bacterium]|nr:hypothetical protein [Xanthomonadales bacterium]
MLAVLALVSSCASIPYMPLGEESASLDRSKPLFLMSVAVRNDYKPRWQPRILTVVLEKPGATGNAERFAFRMDSAGTIPSESGGSIHLVRFPADAASTIVRGFNAMASAFPIHGFYFLPVHAELTDVGSGVHYLGSIKAAVRERGDDEFRAGAVIPLIDQAIAGASTGTFDVEIVDAYDTDVALFRNAFPALRDVEIRRSVLPRWDRARAQLFWDQN